MLKDRHTRGVLHTKRYLCAAAARSGQLEELKALRAKNFPWDKRTCAWAAEGGHLEMLKWRARRMPVGRADVRVGGGGRPPRGAQVGARERLPVDRVDVGGHLGCSSGRVRTTAVE